MNQLFIDFVEAQQPVFRRDEVIKAIGKIADFGAEKGKPAEAVAVIEALLGEKIIADAVTILPEDQ